MLNLFRLAIIAAVGCLSVMSRVSADEISTAVVSQPHAPLALSRCNVVYTNLFQSSYNIYNRSAHAMIDASIEYRFYDRDNAQIGQIAYTYTPANTLSPQDTGTYNNQNIFPNLSEPETAVSKITCKVIGGHFTGHVVWKPDMSWTGGPLSPIPKPAHESDASYQPSSTIVSSTTPSHVKFEVANAWNDATPQGLFVHDSLVLHGTDNPTTLAPSNFSLTMSLAGGAQKTYAGLIGPAPSYVKYNPLGQTNTVAFEVDPRSDFGRLGSIVVPAHGTVTVTITFAVADPVAAPTNNTNVSLR